MELSPNQIKRVVSILTEKLGIYSRDSLVRELAKIDRSQGAEAWKGIADVREDVIEALLELIPEAFTLTTGLPEHDAQPAILPQDSPEG